MELEAASRATFNGTEAFASYQRWAESGATQDLEDAILKAIPVFGKIFWYKVGCDVGFVTASDYLSSVSYKLLVVMQGKSLPLDCELSYVSYLYKVVRGSILAEYGKARSHSQRVFSSWTSCAMPPQGRLVSVADVDAKLFIEALPRMIAVNVAPRIRFSGVKRRACLVILERYATGKLLSKRMIEKYFNLPKAEVEFLMEYVAVAVRRYLYDIRDDLREVGGAAIHWRGLYEWVNPPTAVYRSGYFDERTPSVA